MKAAVEDLALDAIAEKGDVFEIQVDDQDLTGGLKLFVHCNGRTVVRIGKIDFGSVYLSSGSLALTKSGPDGNSR